MKSKNIGKIMLSLFIALAFIMPITALGNEVEVVSSRQQSGNDMSTTFNSHVQAPLAPLAEVCIVEIQNFTDPMAEGCYEFDILLEKTNLVPTGQEVECDIKLFLDIWKEDEIVPDEIYCTDFEDTGDIYNNWEACDGPSGDGSSPDCAIDTWAWSDARSHSPGHSMHSSQFDTYMGNQNDYLILYLELEKDYDELKLVFWHWMEGEEIEVNGSSNTELEDWGIVQYSYDGINWDDVSPRYFDNNTWDEVVLWITDSGGEDDIWIRWYWHTGPICQYEGWYVDDVCLYGYQGPGWGIRVFDTFSQHAITIPADLGFFNYIFDEGYCFDEGNYSIRIWMINETMGCDVCYPQSDPFWFNFTIKDIYDIAVTANDFEITNDECNGGDLIVTGEVCNVGTVDAYDVQVTFSIQEQIIEKVFEDFIEGDDFSDWQISYNGYTPDDIDWFVTEYDSYSPTHSWTTRNETTGHARQQSCGVFTPEFNPFEGDPISLDFLVKMKYSLTSDMSILPAFLADSYYWGFDDTTIFADPNSRIDPIAGPDAIGWTEFSLNELISTHSNYWEERYWGPQTDFADMIILFNERYGPDGQDVEDFTAIRMGFYFLADTSGFGPGYTGMFLDDYRIIKILPGAERYSETIIIPELPVGECVDVEFVWEDMPTGNFIESKCVPPDDNDENNCMSGSFEIWSELDCADELEMESQDLTTADANHWHVTSSGYDNYMWAGEEESCTYNDSWNDPLCITDEGNATFDMTGVSEFTFDFWDYFEGDGGSGDYGLIEINPAVSEPNSQWYQYDPTPVNLIQEDFESGAPGWTMLPVTGIAPWMIVPYGWAWTGHDAFLGGSPVNYAIADSDFFGPGTDCEMISPAIDMSIPGTYTINYRVLWYISGGEIAQIEAYSGGGFTFEEVLFDYGALPGVYAGGEFLYIDPSGYTDPSQVYLRFHYNDMGVWQWYWMVDDVGVNFLLDPPTPASQDHGWTHQVMTFDSSVHLDHFKNPYTLDTFANEVGGLTDDMGLRFRFVSDDFEHYRGWLLNNFSLLFDGTPIIDNDPLDDHTNLIACGINGGDWWTYYSGPEEWCNEDVVSGIIPNDVDNALVWDTSVPQAMAAVITFEHDYDIDAGDYVYLEFSTNGGSSWVSPIRFTGSTPGWTEVEIDMTAFSGDNVLVRWRVNTNATDPSTFYCLRNICIKAQVDTVAPITIGSISGTMIYGWYSSPVTFTATASDDVSGVAATYYKIDGGSTLTYSAPITINVNGEHQIEFWSVDNVGNEEVHQFTPTFKIDTGDAPSVSITAPGDGLYLFGNQLLSLSGRTIIIGGFTVQATASDDDSGVYAVTFALDGTVFGEDASSPYSSYCGEKHTGAGTITVTAEDFTGQTASASKDITYFKFL